MSQNIDLSPYGITDVREIVHNPSYEQLFEEELREDLEGYERGVLTESGAVAVRTGEFTGRSPKDKFIVYDEVSRDNLWWTSKQAPNDNKPITPAVWAELKALVARQLTGKRLFRMAPIHHHYELKGWPEPRVIVRFWIITVMLVLFGLATLKLR